MNKKLKLLFFALAVSIVVWLAMGADIAFATGDEHGNGECDHPRFVEHGCGEAGPPGPIGPQGEQGEQGLPGRDGIDGADGRDGVDGKDGRDGIDGINGRDGRDGIDGKDGEVPIEWLIETRRWYHVMRDTAAAEAAMQVYLPQDQTSRLTGGMSRVNGVTGYALGYAYMLDSDRNSALTLAVGRAGDETAIKGSFGFEFGGDRSSRIPSFAPAPAPAPAAVLYETPVVTAAVNDSAFDVQTLVADLTDEQYDQLRREIQMNDEANTEQYELVEYRQTQQKNLIESQAQELERLRKEAEALRAAEEARKTAEAEAQAKFKARLAQKGE